MGNAVSVNKEDTDKVTALLVDKPADGSDIKVSAFVYIVYTIIYTYAYSLLNMMMRNLVNVESGTS